MKRIRQIGASRIAITAMAVLLATTGAAVAAGGGSGGERGGPGHGPGGRGGPGGPGAGQYLTYSEVHTYKRGAETVMRTDAGKIVKVDSNSITLTRRDGEEVTTEIDADTEIHIPGNEDATVDDLTVGKRVFVSGEKGKAADVVGVPGRGGRR